MLALIATLPFVYPFLFIFNVALKPETEYVHDRLGPPNHISFSIIERVWTESNLGRGLINSLIAVSVGSFVVMIVSVCAAYWLSRRTSRLSRTIMGYLVAAWMFPWVVWLIPFFVLVSRLGAGDNLIVLGVVYGAWNIPFGVYLLFTFMRQSLPREVLEAAEIDGCTIWQQFIRIVVPLSKPALATLGALAFVWSWGDLLMAATLMQSEEHRTLTVAAATVVGKYETSVQELAAAATVTIVPLLVVFLLAQRAIVRGFTGGAVKG